MSLVENLVGLFEKISPTFWGVFIGSFFSLGGVMLTNRANDKRLKQQLSHDRELKKHERELTIKKEVFMDAAEAISTGINAVGNLANLDIHEDKLNSAFIEKSSAIAKVYVISQTDTIKTIDSMVSELSAIYMRLLAKKIPLLIEKQQIDFIQKQKADFEQLRDRMLEMMRQYNITGESDPRKWSVLGQNYDFEAKRIDDKIKEYSERGVKLYLDQISFMRECIEETKKLRLLHIPVIKAVRAELELPFDENRYSAIIEENIMKQERSVEDFTEKVRSSISAQLSVVDEETLSFS